MSDILRSVAGNPHVNVPNIILLCFYVLIYTYKCNEYEHPEVFFKNVFCMGPLQSSLNLTRGSLPGERFKTPLIELHRVSAFFIWINENSSVLRLHYMLWKSRDLRWWQTRTWNPWIGQSELYSSVLWVFEHEAASTEKYSREYQITKMRLMTEKHPASGLPHKPSSSNIPFAMY